MTDLFTTSVRSVVQAMYQFMINDYAKSRKDVVEFEDKKHEVFQSIYVTFSFDKYEAVADSDLESMIQLFKEQYRDSVEMGKLQAIEFRIANRSKDVIEFITKDQLGARIIGKLVHVRICNNNKIEHNFAIMTQKVIYTLKPEIKDMPQTF